MFGKGAHGGGHKKKGDGGPIVGAIRFFLSLIILAILGIGLLLAYRNFSGVNPLNLSPQQLFKSLLSPDSAYSLITGLLTIRPQDSLTKAKDALTEPGSEEKDEQQTNSLNDSKPTAPLSFKFAIIADSHKDTADLKKALAQAKQAGAKFVVGLGDLSDVGTVDELRNSKEQFDMAELPYYIAPGDHDLWDSRDKGKPASQNSTDIFGQPYQSFAYDSVRFILVYNSDNYKGIDELQLNWLQDELKRSGSDQKAKLIFVALPTPIYHPSSDHVMGKVSPSLKNQADHLIDLFKKNGVDEVFAADTHYYTRYVEPTMDLKMTTVGAVTSDRNPQSPRFTMVEVYEDNSYQVRETVLE